MEEPQINNEEKNDSPNSPKIENNEEENIQDAQGDEKVEIEQEEEGQGGQEDQEEQEEQEEIEEEEKEEKEEIEPSKEIALLYESLLEFYSKKQFKKILKTIILKADKDEKFNLLEWKLLYLRTSTIQRILSKKNFVYFKSSKVPHFVEYIQKFNNDINNWISFTQELKYQNELLYADSFLEFIILFVLQKINILSRNYIHSRQIKDAIGILSLGVRLIKKTFNFMKNPDSYTLAGEIFLSLSSFMIAEEIFSTAKAYICASIKFLYLCLEITLFKSGINYKSFNLTEYNNEISQLSKIFFNLSVAFYQLGICYENEGDPYNALYAIKTSKFLGYFVNNEESELFKELVKEIEARLLMRNRIIIFFIEKNVKKEEMEEKAIKIKRIYHRFDQEERKRQKFRRIKNYVEKLKLVDIDDDEPDLFNKVGCKPINENVLKTTKQIHLLNFLMSNDFKDVINSMSKIEINKLEKDTVNKIQKRIIVLKNNERAKLEEKAKNEQLIKKLLEMQKQVKDIKKEKEEKILKSQNPNQNKVNINKSNTLISNSVSLTTTNTRHPRISSAYKSINRKYLLTHNEDQKSYKTIKTIADRPNSDSIYTSPSRFISTTDNYPSSKKKFYFSRDKIINAKNNINIFQKIKSSKTDKTNKNQKSKIKKNVFKYTPRYIPRYNYNDYYFNKKFKKKYNFLENQYDKEIEFQKQLLKTKFYKDYSLKPEPFNYRDLEKKVEEFYHTTYENELMNAKEKQIIFDKSELLNKARMPRRLFSADYHKLYSPNLKKEKDYLNMHQIKEMNDECINDITNKISKISSQEKKILRKKRKLLK